MRVPDPFKLDGRGTVRTDVLAGGTAARIAAVVPELPEHLIRPGARAANHWISTKHQL